MDEYKKKALKIAVAIVLFFVCVALVIVGHSMGFMSDFRQGLIGLGVQLIGLAGILVLLYLYNKPYAK